MLRSLHPIEVVGIIAKKKKKTSKTIHLWSFVSEIYLLTYLLSAALACSRLIIKLIIIYDLSAFYIDNMPTTQLMSSATRDEA